MHERIISKTFFDADSKAMSHLAEWAATPAICLVGRQRRKDNAKKPIAGTHEESDTAEEERGRRRHAHRGVAVS
jgi:hypothetical protein